MRGVTAVVCLAFGLSGLGGPTWASDDAPMASSGHNLIEAPDYIRRPTGADFARFFPDEAMVHGVSGRTAMHCRVTAEGAMSACEVTAETPLGWGFGGATLKLAPYFKMRPMTSDSRSVAGAAVVLPIAWRVGATEPLLGEAGYVLSIVDGKGRGETVGCPTAAEPSRRCLLHPVAWDVSPKAEELLGALGANPGVRGVSQALCSVSDKGKLLDCSALANATSEQKSVMPSLTSHLAPAYKTFDGSAAWGAQMIIEFDWSELNAEASRLKR